MTMTEGDGAAGEDPTTAYPAGEVELLVCTTCRSAAPADPLGGDAEGPRAGARLIAALEGTLPTGVTLRAVECLSNCQRGCTIALRGPGRWSYVYGGLDPDTDPDTVREGAERYRDAPDGRVPWRERPQHFRKNCIARVPPLEGP